MNASVLGRFKFHNLRLNFDRLAESRILALRPHLAEYQNRFKISVACLPNGNFVIAYQTTNNNVNILCMDRTGAVQHAKNSIIPIPSTSSLVYDVKLVHLVTHVYLYVWYYHINFGHRFCVVCYDETLNIQTKIHHDYPIHGFVAFDAKLFALSAQNGVNRLAIYDAVSLENVANLGQKCARQPYFFALTTRKLEVNATSFFLLDTSGELTVMNRLDGLVTRSFDARGTDFSLYLDQHVLSFDTTTRKFYSFDFGGKMECELSLESVTAGNQLCGVSDEELVFYDSQQVSLNFLSH